MFRVHAYQCLNNLVSPVLIGRDPQHLGIDAMNLLLTAALPVVDVLLRLVSNPRQRFGSPINLNEVVIFELAAQDNYEGIRLQRQLTAPGTPETTPAGWL